MSVAIVIPCFRQGHWLAQAIESCLAQSLPPREIVVVNDGSDDSTEEVARSFGERIRYVAQANAGVAAARNHGLRVTTAEHLLFLDADDALHSEALEKLHAAADATTITMMGWRAFEHRVDEPTAEQWPPTHDAIPALLRHNPGPPHTFLSPRRSLQAICGWDENLSGTADWDCWSRQLFAGAGLAPVPFIGAHYRNSATQMSRNELSMTRDLAITSEKLFRLAVLNPDRLRAWGLEPDATFREFRDRAAREYKHLAWLHRERGQRREAAGHYWHSFKLSPTLAGVKSLLTLPMAKGAA